MRHLTKILFAMSLLAAPFAPRQAAADSSGKDSTMTAALSPAGAADVPAVTFRPAGPADPPVQFIPAPPDYPRGRISGYMFGDAYYNVVGDPRHMYDAKGADQGQANIDGNKAIGRDLNGVQFRRVYFQLDNDLTARFATRFRIEMDGKELSSGGKLGVFVKNAYVQAKRVYPGADVYFGEISTPTYENSETFWQYRSVEKTMLDFLGLRPSSDLGLELKGFADPDHHFGYVAMMGDGMGQKNEIDRFKTWYFSLPLRFGDLHAEPYVDYQAMRVNPNKTAISDTAANNDQATYKIFLGYEFRRLGLGVEGFDRVNHLGAKPSAEPRGLSVFARGMLAPTFGAFVRFDGLMTDVRNDNRVDKQLWIAGVDWQPIREVHVMPNVEATQYIARGTGVVPPHHDLQARLTLYYLFSRPQS